MIRADDLSRPALRRLLRQARRRLSGHEQRLAAHRLYRHLAQHPWFRRARNIALYLPNDGEIDPSLLLAAARRHGKTTYLPVLKPWPRTKMVFQRVRASDPLRPNRFGIPEPTLDVRAQRAAWTLDLILMPLVGFDPQGGRLGMGGGFYDRSFAFLRRRSSSARRPILLGVAHECQKVDRLPLESWDIPLQATVTDQAWYPAGDAPGQPTPPPGQPRA